MPARGSYRRLLRLLRLLLSPSLSLCSDCSDREDRVSCEYSSRRVKVGGGLDLGSVTTAALRHCGGGAAPLLPLLLLLLLLLIPYIPY